MLAEFANDFTQEKIINLAIISASQKTGDLKTSCEAAAKKVKHAEDLAAKFAKVRKVTLL